MSAIAPPTDGFVPSAPRRRRGRRSLAFLGILPFLLFTGVFLLAPTIVLVKASFQDPAGAFTFENVRALFQGELLHAYRTSIEISLVTALVGGLLGALMCYAMTHKAAPRLLRAGLETFSGVAANFAGVPLAFAFISTLGTVGLVTAWLKDAGIDLYGSGFTLFGFWGLALTYLYFQIPLMILVIAPAFDGLRGEWREAATNLGATPAHYWRTVGLPILMPSMLGALLLLFANSFSAYATAYALTGGNSVELAPTLIGNELSGDVLNNKNLGYALAFGMIVIVTACVAAYWLLERRAARWKR